MIGTTVGHYLIEEELGTGGMGVVYRATDRRLRRSVALKFLPESFVDDPERRARLVHEAQVLASLNHPNIAAIYGLEETEQGFALVMEFVEGTTLAGRIERGRMDPDEFYPVALQMCAALRAAHEKDIVHRDVKPANVILMPDGRVKILDFGLAQVLHPIEAIAAPDESTADTPTDGLNFAGTLPYMSPEQLRGDRLDAKSDIYSLGVVLYEMIVGARPFGDSKRAELVRDILDTAPTPPRWVAPDIPAGLAEIVLRCLEKDPAQRYPTMARLYDELRLAACGADSTERSVAVLYFENAGGVPEDEAFCDGITEDIIVELSRLRGLTVLSRSAMLPYRKKSATATDVGRSLGAMYVLDGSVRRSGNRLRISTELVEVRTSRSRWAERYDRQLEDVFAIQQEIAQSIARTLRVVLSESERRGMSKAPTTSVEAYEHYLRGRQYFRQFRRRSIEFAAEMAGRAIAMDPEYALAHAALADCYSYLYMFWEASDAHREAAERASRRAIELGPDLAEAHAARGVAVSISKRYEEADREFETAIRLDPKLFEAYYFCARGFYARGDLERAVTWFERAMTVRPDDYQAPTLLASALAGLGRKEASANAYRLALALAQKRLELDPGETRALYFSAISLAQLGEGREQSIEWAERALAMDPAEPQVLYNVGCVFALLGDRERAFQCFAATIEHGDWWRTWMRNDPDLVMLRDDSRFVALVRDST